MSWTKLEPSKGETSCLTCGCGSHDVMSMDALLAVGFGSVTVRCDGQEVWSEGAAGENGPFWEGKDAEAAAAKDPDHDWRVHFFAPFYGAEYQRQGDGHWPLIKKGEGFA